MATPSSNLTLQNWYESTLTSAIGASDTAIPLNTVPNGTEGFLVIEPDSTTNREVIFFNSKTSSQVTCPSAAQGRGQDGTTGVSHASGSTVRMNFTSGYWNALQNGSGLNIGALAGSDASTGWLTNLLPAVSSVTANGNRSYDVVYASTVASTLSPGMRLRLQRTVAANTYMGGLMNGSSHYFTKATPSGTLGTVTDNFTIMAAVQPTSYAAGMIAARADAAANNGIYLYMQTDGRVTLGIRSGGAANVRELSTYQSVPLNKKTNITASWATGTVVVYFDGIAVPMNATPVTGGTAPTAAGTGGDFSIGRFGANSSIYFTGYISNVAVFNAVLSAATIKQYATYKLTGSETNCIGAWSLDNVATDASASANNLTATGGVGYTNISPFTTDGSGVPGSYDYALVQKVSTTTATVQVPEGCTIPTSGGVTSTSYSVQGNPFGWVSDKGRWSISALSKTLGTQATPVSSTWYNVNSHQLSIPVGTFSVYYTDCLLAARTGAGAAQAKVTVSTANNTESDRDFTTSFSMNSILDEEVTLSVSPKNITNTSATTYYVNRSLIGAATLTNLYQGGDRARCELVAMPSNL